MGNDASDAVEDEIQTWFDSHLDSGYIRRLDVDILRQAIVIEFLINDSSNAEYTTFHTVRFDGVRSIYLKGNQQLWQGDDDAPEDWTIAPEEWAIREGIVGTIEWLYTMFHRSGAYTVRASNGAKGWISDNMNATPNFALSLRGDSVVLLIEANRLTLDGKVYEVGYPSDSGTGALDEPGGASEMQPE